MKRSKHFSNPKRATPIVFKCWVGTRLEWVVYKENSVCISKHTTSGENLNLARDFARRLNSQELVTPPEVPTRKPMYIWWILLSLLFSALSLVVLK